MCNVFKSQVLIFFKIYFSKSFENKNKNQPSSDQVKISSTNGEYGLNIDKSVNSEDSKFLNFI